MLMAMLIGCHVFDSGVIDVTCDELPGCEGIDTNQDTSIEVGFGIAVSHSDGEAWLASVYDSPDLSPSLQISGTGDLLGPVAYDGVDTLYVVSGGLLYAMKSNNDISSTPLGINDATSIALTDDKIFISNGIQLIIYDGSITTELDPEFFTSLMFFDDLLYVVDNDSNNGPDIYGVDPIELTLEFESVNFSSSAARSRAGSFIGPDGDVFMCSGTGAIYNLKDLESGANTPTVFVNEDISDAITCGWESTTNQYTVVTETNGLYILEEDSDDISLDSPTGDTTIYDANLF